MTLPRKKRRLRFLLRVFLLLSISVAIAVGSLSYPLIWIHQRHKVLSRSDIKHRLAPHYQEAPRVAPWQLRMLGEAGYRRVTLVIADEKRVKLARSRFELGLGIDGEWLTADEVHTLRRIGSLFPEASVRVQVGTQRKEQAPASTPPDSTELSGQADVVDLKE